MNIAMHLEGLEARS